MRLRNTKIFFIIERNVKIRQEAFIFETSLKHAFKTPFSIFNVNDEADPNIIRFQTSSLNSFSNLQVAQNKIILETNYDKNYDINYQLVSEYLAAKIKDLKPVLLKEKLIFIGVLSLFDNEMNVAEILPLIKEQTNFGLIDNDIIELKYNYKKKYENKYMLSIDVSPYTRFSAQLPAPQLIKGSFPLKVDSKGLQIKLDFNNNIGRDPNKELSIDVIDVMLSDYFNFIKKNNLNNYIKGLLL